MNTNVGPHLIRFIFNYSNYEYCDWDDILVEQEALHGNGLNLGDIGYTIISRFVETDKYRAFAPIDGYTDQDMGGFSMSISRDGSIKLLIDVTLYKKSMESTETQLSVEIVNGNIKTISFRQSFTHGLYFKLTF